MHGVRAHRKYDLAYIIKLVTDYIYTRLSGGQFNFSGLTVEKQAFLAVIENKTREKTRSSS